MATANGSEASVQSTKQNLLPGCRVELTGLSSADLNGQRGSINGSYLADRGRWPVVVDGTGRKLSCQPTNLKDLASCGYCGTEKVQQLLKKCTRCRAMHYCSSDCQRAHWKRGGHKRACREQFACTICLDDEDHPLPIQCGCGCRDAAGCAHVACKAAYAEHQGPGYNESWHKCPTCKQIYTGAMQLGLAEALWVRLQSRPAKDDDRLRAQTSVAGAYFEAGRFAEAEALHRSILATRRHLDGPNHRDDRNGACAVHNGAERGARGCSAPGQFAADLRAGCADKRIAAGPPPASTQAPTPPPEGGNDTAHADASTAAVVPAPHQVTNDPPEQVPFDHSNNVDAHVTKVRAQGWVWTHSRKMRLSSIKINRQRFGAKGADFCAVCRQMQTPTKVTPATS